MSAASEELSLQIRLLLEAVNDRDLARLRALVPPDFEVVTGRAVHAGAPAVLAWAGRAYEHLERRYAVDRIEPVGSGYLALGRVQYVWRETDEVGDSSPIVFSFELERGRLRRMTLHDDESSARDALGG